MKFTVMGADAGTGADKSIDVEADNKAQAERVARKRGLLVSAVQPAPADETPSAATLLADAPLPLEYRGAGEKPAPTPPAAPQYSGLIFARQILTAVAILYYVLTLLILAMVLVQITQVQSSGDWPRIFPALASFLVCAGAGGLVHGLSAACEALRDIARNSWRR